MNSKLFAVFVFGILVLSLFAHAVHAESGSEDDGEDSESDDSGEDSESDDNSGSSEDDSADTAEGQEAEVEDVDSIDKGKIKVKVSGENSGKGKGERKVILDSEGNEREVEVEIEEEGSKFKLKVKSEDDSEREVESELEIETETEDDKVKIKVKVSNGDFKDILVLPDQALEIVKSKVNISENASVELEERNEGNVPKVVYNIESNKNGKFLGVFKMSYRVNAEVDSETGEIITSSNGPWWAAFVKVTA